MKQLATLVSVLFYGIFGFNIQEGIAQPVNTHRAFTWDGWPANSLSQPLFYNNLGPDNVDVSLSFAFSGIPSLNVPKTYTYANQSGRTSSLKVEKMPGSEDTLTGTLTFDKNLDGLSMEINPYDCSYVVVKAVNKAGTHIPLAAAYDISYTDPVNWQNDTIFNTGDLDVHIYFTGPVSKVTFKAVRTNAHSNGMEFAIGPVSWFNTLDYIHNPDYDYNCEGNEIMVIMDASTSIDVTERSQLITAVGNMLNTLKYYSTSPNYVCFVEFCTKSRIGLDYTMITPATISPGGAIYNYLHNTTGSGYYSTNSLYGGYTNWSQAYKVALDKARLRKPGLLIFFTDGAPNKIFEENDGNSSNLLYSAAWGVNRTSLYADSVKDMGIHILGIGTDKINTVNRDFYFRYAIEMSNPVIYDYTVPPPSNLSTADYVTVPTFASLDSVFVNLFISCLAYLPVKFTSLQIQQNGCNANTVSWSMDNSESAESYFVEKSLDGVNFINLARVNPVNAIKAGSYSCTDNNINAQNIFYRVKAVSKSGENTYSKVAMAQTPCLNNQLTIWPNPVRSDKLSLQFTHTFMGSLFISVYDMSGRKIIQRSVSKTQSTILLQEDLHSLSNGMYSISISDKQNLVLSQTKFIKQ